MKSSPSFKLLFSLIGICAASAASDAIAGTINFDNAPVGVDLKNFYQGITFGTGDQATVQILPYLPAHSGTQALSGSGTANTLSFTFSTPQTSLSFYYISYLGFAGKAYSANGTMVGTITGINNYNTSAILSNPTTFSQYTMASLNTGIANISTVILTATSGSSAFTFVDDLSAPGVTGIPTPDASSTLTLLGISGAGLAAVRRRFTT